MKTVFFGPFIGEFGWEMLFWHAYVNKLSNTKYKDYVRIVASYPGREFFYPSSHEFWSHPEVFSNKFKVQNGYITDNWRSGIPCGNKSTVNKLFGCIPYEKWEWIKSDLSYDIADIADQLLKYYLRKLPHDVELVVPFHHNISDDFTFGVKEKLPVSYDQDITQLRIPFDKQQFFSLKPEEKYIDILPSYIPIDKPIIAIYPRYRETRRPDKNWPEYKYIELINLISKKYNRTHNVVLFGAPGGAYFSDGKIPANVFSLINVPSEIRGNLQIAALKHAVVAIGGLSGAVIVARAANVPVVSWGLARDKVRFCEENTLNNPSIYHCESNPNVLDILRLSEIFINNVDVFLVPYVDWDSKNYLKKGNGNVRPLYAFLKNYLSTIFFSKN